MKRVLCLFLVVLLTLSILCSCQNTTPTTSTDTSAPADTSDDVSQDTSSSEYVSGLPSDLRFDGEEFVILSSYTNEITEATMVYFGGDGSYEFEGNVVNDASIERINRVEERLGVDIIEHMIKDSQPGGSASGTFYSSVYEDMQSGLSQYHMAQGSLYNLGILTTAGCLNDMANFKYFDNFENDWWSQTFINDVSIRGSVYYAVGDISIGHTNCIYLIYYNKEVQKNNEIEDLYTLVDNNQWTYDKMFELSSTLPKNLDNDPNFTAVDQFGIVGQASVMWAIPYATGAHIIKKDADGNPTFSLNDESTLLKIQEALEFLTQEGNYLIVDGTKTTIDQGFATFYEDRTLFMPDHTGNINRVIGQMESDFGFMPHPKYDENQEEYYSLISGWGGLGVCIPYVLDPEKEDFVSAVMEEMAVQGKNLLTVAFIEKLCKLQKTTDDRSKDMLDIVFNNAGCELGQIHKIGTFPTEFQKMLSGKKTDVASLIDQFKDKAQNDIDLLISAIENMQ